MVLKELEVENFRSFYKFRIKPTGINIIVGRNNSGKTSLLETLSFIFNHESEIRLFSSNPRLLINAQDTEAGSTISFVFNREKAAITLKNAVPEEIYSDLKDRFKRLFIDYVRFYKSNKIQKIPEKLPFLVRALSEIIESGKLELIIDEYSRTDPFNALMKMLLKTSLSISGHNTTKLIIPENIDLLDPHSLKILIEIISKHLNFIENKEDRNASSKSDEEFRVFLYINREILSLHSSGSAKMGSNSIGINSSYFRKISRNESYNLRSTDDIANIETESLRIENFIRENKLLNNLQRFGFRSIVFGKEGNTYEIPMELMGDGFVALINIIREITRKPEPQVIAIEEPERDLHPGYIAEFTKYIVRLAMETGRQFFITTHSDDFLKSLFKIGEENKEMDAYISRELSIIRLSKVSGKSVCRVRNFNEAKEELVDLELDLRGL